MENFGPSRTSALLVGLSRGVTTEMDNVENKNGEAH